MVNDQMLDLFDIRVPVERIYTQWTDSRPPTDLSKAEWKAYAAAKRCADCQRFLTACATTHSCGGARREGAFELCDDCAAVDDIAPGRSRWGITSTDEEHERLVELQLVRRAKCGMRQ